MHEHTHTHARTHARTHAHTHTHTHARCVRNCRCDNYEGTMYNSVGYKVYNYNYSVHWKCCKTYYTVHPKWCLCWSNQKVYTIIAGYRCSMYTTHIASKVYIYSWFQIHTIYSILSLEVFATNVVSTSEVARVPIQSEAVLQQMVSQQQEGVGYAGVLCDGRRV